MVFGQFVFSFSGKKFIHVQHYADSGGPSGSLAVPGKILGVLGVFLVPGAGVCEKIGEGLGFAGLRGARHAEAEAARLGTKAGIEGGGFAIDAPLQFMSKADIASEADRLGLDTGLSWSCYDPRGDGLPCGLCDSCRLRLGGFAAAGLEDGLTYPAR